MSPRSAFAIVVIGRRGRTGGLAVTPRRGVGTTLKVHGLVTLVP